MGSTSMHVDVQSYNLLELLKMNKVSKNWGIAKRPVQRLRYSQRGGRTQAKKRYLRRSSSKVEKAGPQVKGRNRQDLLCGESHWWGGGIRERKYFTGKLRIRIKGESMGQLEEHLKRPIFQGKHKKLTKKLPKDSWPSWRGRWGEK